MSVCWQSERNETAADLLRGCSDGFCSLQLPLMPAAGSPYGASTCMWHTYPHNMHIQIHFTSAASFSAASSAVTSIVSLLFFLLSSSVYSSPLIRPPCLPCAVCQGDSDRSSIQSHIFKAFFACYLCYLCSVSLKGHNEMSSLSLCDEASFESVSRGITLPHHLYNDPIGLMANKQTKTRVHCFQLLIKKN